MRTLSQLGRLWGHIEARQKNYLVLLFLFSIITSFAEVMSIGLVLPFLGALTSTEAIFVNPNIRPFILFFGFTNPSELLLPMTLIFMVASLLSGSMRLLLLWMEVRLSFAIGADFSYKIYRATLYQSYSTHIARNSSQILSAISTKTTTIIERILLPLMRLASSSMILISIIIVLIIINPFVAISSIFCFGVVYSGIVFCVSNRLKYDSEKINIETTRVIKALQEGLGGIRDVLIDGTQEIYCKLYQDADLPLRRSQANILIIGSAPRYLIEPFGMALIAFLGYELVVSEQGIIGAVPVLGIIVIGAQRMLPLIQQVYGSWSTIIGFQSTLQDVLTLLEQPLPAHIHKSVTNSISFTRSIKLNNLGFRYSDNDPWILKSVDLEIKKGGRIGIIGATGSGKSTLLDLFMCLLKPIEGTLIIDDISITSSNYRAWQSHVAHVPQSIFLIDATITENIAFGITPERIDHERVKYAAKIAQIADTIDSWSQKYDTVVGERGVRLSGGQLQRIGIARALYKRADVIIFDEATSALDNDTEQKVMQGIRSIADNVTVFLVAHRLTTLIECDTVIELENGRIKQIGSWNNVVSKTYLSEYSSGINSGISL